MLRGEMGGEEGAGVSMGRYHPASRSFPPLTAGVSILGSAWVSADPVKELSIPSKTVDWVVIVAAWCIRYWVIFRKLGRRIHTPRIDRRQEEAAGGVDDEEEKERVGDE